MFRIKEHSVTAQHIREYPRATRDSQEVVLQLAIKQYIPLNSTPTQPDAVTIIGAHANGFPKELYEPLWEELLQRADAAGFAIRGIWIADIASQGRSGVLNEKKLGNDPSWFDHPRDLLHMINHFRDEMPRPIIGIGHSVGAAHLVNLSLIHSRLLESVILIDPVVQRASSPRGQHEPALLSSVRRDLWPSREVAKASFLRSRFYQAWDPRVLDKWVQYGLRELPTEVYPRAQGVISPAPSTTAPTLTPQKKKDEEQHEVTLMTTKHQEVFLFLRPHFGVDKAYERLVHPDFGQEHLGASPFYRAEVAMTFHNLPFLRPSAFYILGAESDMNTPANIEDKLVMTGTGVGGSGGAREGRVKHVIVAKTGHLVPMEKVEETADLCAGWIGEEMKRWRRSEAWLRDRWSRIPESDKFMLSKQHLEMLKASTQKELAATGNVVSSSIPGVKRGKL